MAEENPRKKLWQSLRSGSDKELSKSVGRYSAKRFDELLATNPDFQNDLFLDLKERGMADDPQEFARIYLQPTVAPTPQPAAPRETPKPAPQLATRAPEPSLIDRGIGFVKGLFKKEPEKPVEMPKFQQWENQAEIEQSAKSPVFRAQNAAQMVLDEQKREAGEGVGQNGEPLLTWRQNPKTGKFSVYEYNDFDDQRPLATFDTKEEAANAIRNPTAATNGLIFQTKEAERRRDLTPEQRRQAIEGSTGAQLAKSREHDKQTFGERWGLGGKMDQATVAGAENMLGNVVAGIKNTLIGMSAGLATPSSDPNIQAEREKSVKEADAEMYKKSQELSRELTAKLAQLNIEPDAWEQIKKGDWSRIPEATMYTIMQGVTQIVPALATYGTSTYFQTLPQAYEAGVEAKAKALGITPEEVIATGQDDKEIAQLSAAFQAVLERAGAGLVSQSIKKEGLHKVVKDWVLNKVGRNRAGRILGGAAGVGAATFGEGLTGAGQEMTSVAQEGYSAGQNPIAAIRENRERIVGGGFNEAIGGGGLIAGGKLARAALPGRRPPAQLGGIPTQPAPPGPTKTMGADGSVIYTFTSTEDVPVQYRDRVKQGSTGTLNGKPYNTYRLILTPDESADFEIQDVEFEDVTSPEIPNKSETTYTPVTPEEYARFEQGDIDPDRLAGIEDDLANGVTTSEDPLYQKMLEVVEKARQDILQTNDSQDETPIQTESNQGAGTETAETGGNVQVDEEVEIAPEDEAEYTAKVTEVSEKFPDHPEPELVAAVAVNNDIPVEEAVAVVGEKPEVAPDVPATAQPESQTAVKPQLPDETVSNTDVVSEPTGGVAVTDEGVGGKQKVAGEAKKPAAPTKEQSPLKDVESTAKALDGSSLKGIVFADKNGVEKIVVQDNKGGGFLIKNNDGKPQNPTMGNHKDISEAYHKAKKDGSNPELVKAVEELIGKPESKPTTIEDKGKASTPASTSPALSSVESKAKALEGKKLSLDEKAKKLGYIGIKQFNAQNQLNENLTDEEKALLQEYSDFQQEIKNLKDENVIAKLSDDEFSTWSKANDITRDDLGKVVKDEEIELAAKRIRILNARGDSKKAESELKKLKESKKKDNWTKESWKERFDEDIEQSEIDEINSSNKEFNKSVDKAVESLLSKEQTPTEDTEAKKAEVKRLEKELFEKSIPLKNWTSVEHNKYVTLLGLRGDVEKRDLLRNLEPSDSWQLYAVETLSEEEAKEVLNNVSTDAKADIPIGKVGNTHYEVKTDGVYFEGKKLDNPDNKTHKQLIEADIERRRQEELNSSPSIELDYIKQYLPNLFENVDKKEHIEDVVIFVKEHIKKDKKLTNTKELEEAAKRYLDKTKYKDIVDKRINAKYDAELKAVESLLSKEQTEPATQEEIEATAKALEGVQRENVDKFVSDFANIDIPFRQENIQAEMDSAVKKQLFPNEKTRRKYAETIYSAVVRSSNFPKILSEAYHKAKADGSNPELVKAVEDLLAPTSAPEKAPTKEQPPVAPKKRAPKQLKFTSDEDAQAFLDEVGIDPDNLPALLLPFGSRQGKNVAKAVNKMMEADRIEDFIDEEDKGLMKDVSRLKSAIEEARKENPKEFLQGLIDRAEAALKERTRPGTMNDFVKVALDGLLQAYIGILKAAQAAGRYISRKQAMAEARASLKGKHSETDLEMAVMELERREGERIRNAIKKAAGVRNVKDRVQAAIDKAFAVGMGYGKQEGFQKGATAGMKAGDVSGRQTAVRMLKVALQELKADLNPRQINGLLTRMERIKNMTPEAKERFSDYAEKVVENANYVLQERAATKLQGRVRAMAESAATPAGDKALYAGFSDLSIAHMEPDVLSEYLNWAEKIVGKKLTKGDRELLSDFTSRQSKVQTRIKEGRAAKARATREQNQRDEYDRLKKEGELPEGVTTFEEYVESTKTSRPAKDRLGMVKERLANLVAPEGADPKDVEVVGQFKKADLSLLSDADLDFLDNALYEFEDNGNLSGVGRLLSKIKGLEGVAKAEPTRRLVEKKDADKYTVTQLFNALWRGRLGSNAARAALIQPALSAFGKGHIVYEKERLELARLAKQLKLTGENWNRIDLFGFLNEAEDNPELFEKLKNQKLSDLARLKEEVAAYQPTSFVGKAAKFLRPNEVVKALEERLTNLDAAVKSMGLTTESTLEDVKANLTQNEKRLYDKLRETLDKYSPEAMRNIRLYGNRDLGYIKNYWPRMAHRMDASEQLLPDELEDFGLYENDKIGKDLFGRQKGRTKLLGKSGVYETSGRVNFFNGLREMILIGEAADEYAQMQAVYNDKRGFDSLVKDKGFGGAKQVKELLVSYIRDLKAYGRYATDVRSVAKYAVDTAQKNLTGALLKNPTQALKQPTALAYTASQSPTAFAKAMEIFVRPKYAQAVSQLTHYSTLPFREMLPEITRMSELMDSDSSPLIDKIKTARAFINKYTGSNVITDTDKMVSAVSMLTGYIQHQVESGAIKKASDFDLEAEAEKGFDITAIAAGETLQAEANNENTRVLFSNKQKNAQGAYFLMNFTRNATMNLYNNIGKVFRPDATRTERIEGLQGILGYAGSAYLFNLAAQASALLVKQAFLSMFGDDDDEEKMKAYDEATALSRRDGLLYKEIQNVVAGTQPIWAQMAAQAAAAALFEQWQRNQQKKVREGEAEETERTKKEYRPLFQPETPGIAGVAVEELEALAQPVFQGDEEAIMNQLLLTMAKTTGFEALSWLKQNKMRFDKRVKKAEKFGGREAQEKARSLYLPSEQAERKAKEGFRAAIETGNAEAAKESIEKLVSTQKTGTEKYKAVKGVLKSVIGEKELTDRVGIEEKYLDEFFQVLQNQNPQAGGKKAIRVERMKQIASDPELSNYFKDRLSKEYESAKKALALINTLKVKSPATGRAIEFGKPVWMKKYERIVLNQK